LRKYSFCQQLGWHIGLAVVERTNGLAAEKKHQVRLGEKLRFATLV